MLLRRCSGGGVTTWYTLDPRGVATTQGFDSEVIRRPRPENPRCKRGGCYYHEANNTYVTMNVFFTLKASHMVKISLVKDVL